MNIFATQFDLSHRAYEFYFSGCNFKCKNCQNADLWDFNIGTPWKEFLEKNAVWAKIRVADVLVKRIVLLGGEPLHQDIAEFEEFCKELKTELPNHEKVLFTGFELENVDKELIKYFDLIKCGQYKEELAGENIQEGYELATTNQQFHRLKQF